MPTLTNNDDTTAGAQICNVALHGTVRPADAGRLPEVAT